MSVSITTVPNTNVQLAAACQGLLGQASGCQLNAIIQGTGHYWNPNEAHTSGQAQSLGNIRDTSYVDIQGQRQGVLTNPQVAQTTKSVTWIRGNCYGGSGQNAILITAAASGTAYVLDQGFIVYGGGGAGGVGGYPGASSAGGDGAQGIVIQGATTKVLYNQAGTIYGGGGGGGGGAARLAPLNRWAIGGGGGGGMSFGAGGTSYNNAVNGQAATATTAGGGGYHGDIQGGIYGGSGGGGAGVTGTGQAGQAGNTAYPGYAASAGGGGGQGTATFTTVNQQGGARN